MLVRITPIRVHYLTGQDAVHAREISGYTDRICEPCFVTDDMGYDGLLWDTAEQFEDDYTMANGDVE
jgi:hypothetical protein